MNRPNPIHPDRLTPQERLAEVCRLLAVGLIRLRTRQSSQLTSVRPRTLSYWIYLRNLDFPPARPGGFGYTLASSH